MVLPQPNDRPGTESPSKSETREQTLRLLRAISAEMADLAQDIIRLGEALSGQMSLIKQAGGMHDLQNFDLIAQSAQSHAQLLNELIDTMTHSPECDPSRLETLIEIIPFHGVRGRLNAALKGLSVQEDAPPIPDNEADWF